MSDPVEPHTDCPGSTDAVLIAYEAVLPATEGDKSAAATLAVGAVIADALQRDPVVKPQVIAAPPGFEYLEIHGSEVYRAAVVAVAYLPDYGLVPLGVGDKVADHGNVTALVLPDGQVEQEGTRWPSIDAFLVAKGIGEQVDAA